MPFQPVHPRSKSTAYGYDFARRLDESLLGTRDARAALAEVMLDEVSLKALFSRTKGLFATQAGRAVPRTDPAAVLKATKSVVAQNQRVRPGFSNNSSGSIDFGQRAIMRARRAAALA